LLTQRREALLRQVERLRRDLQEQVGLLVQARLLALAQLRGFPARVQAIEAEK